MASQPPPPRVYVAYDYGCAYSYVGKLRADALDERLDVEWVWLPWEMYPSIPDEGEPLEDVDTAGEHPVEGLVGELADEIGETLYWPPRAPNTQAALLGAQVARETGPEVFERYHAGCFEAVWKQGLNLGDEAVLASIADAAGLAPERFLDRLDGETAWSRVANAQDAVDRLGLTRRPTFVFGDQRIVGTDAFEPSLAGPLEAFVDRWQRYGPERTSRLEVDASLQELR